MAIVELPSGGSVKLKDPEHVTYGERKRLSQAWKRSSLAQAADDGTGNTLEATEVLVEIVVESWELPYAPGAALPKDDPGWQDTLQAPDYDKIVYASAETQKNMYLNTEPDPDEASPTVPSAGSEPA